MKKWIKFIVLGVLFLGYTGALGYLYYLQNGTFGSGYRPITDYDARLTSFATASGASFSVNTTKDRASNEISLSNISPSSTPYVYFTVEPGITGQEEIIACNAKSTNTWSGCLRGLNFQGGDLTASSTLAHAHNAGSRIIMSNVGQFYSEFLTRHGADTRIGILSFNDFPVTTGTTALPVSQNQLVTKLYADSVGAGGFTAVNASTSQGLTVYTGLSNCATTSACVGLNVSSTNGLTIFYDGSLGANVSSTDSDNGGFLDFVTSTNGKGKFVWNFRSLINKAITWTGNWILGNNVTSTGTLRAQTPTSTFDVATKGYVDSGIAYGTATGTAGVAVSPGQTLYISATGTLLLATASTRVAALNYVGIALNTAALGAQVSYLRPGTTADNQTGLIIGNQYFLSNTPGTVAATPGTFPVRIGTAIATSTLLLATPSFHGRSTGNFTMALNSNTTISTGFDPTRIDFICFGGGSPSPAVGAYGFWMLNPDGTSSTGSIGGHLTATDAQVGAGGPCRWDEGGSNLAAIWVVTSTGGFQVFGNGYVQTRYIQWTATTDDLMFPRK